MAFGQAFEQRFVAQGDDVDRAIENTLILVWDLLSMLPADNLARVSDGDIARHHHKSAAKTT